MLKTILSKKQNIIFLQAYKTLTKTNKKLLHKKYFNSQFIYGKKKSLKKRKQKKYGVPTVNVSS